MSRNKPEITLRVYYQDRQVFSSSGKWLHPLFELEDFLTTSSLPRQMLRVEDKIVGKAAALLMVRLEIPQVTAGLLSTLGQAVLERFGVDYETREIVDHIDCQTESLLADVEDPEKAYQMVKARVSP